MVYAPPSADTADHLDAVFAALSHPARRELVSYLAANREPARMSDLAAAHGLSPQLLNKHTAALEKAGLARRTGDGPARYLVLDPDVLAEAQSWISRTRAFWQQRFDALDAYIETVKEERHG